MVGVFGFKKLSHILLESTWQNSFWEFTKLGELHLQPWLSHQWDRECSWRELTCLERKSVLPSLHLWHLCTSGWVPNPLQRLYIPYSHIWYRTSCGMAIPRTHFLLPYTSSLSWTRYLYSYVIPQNSLWPNRTNVIYWTINITMQIFMFS